MPKWDDLEAALDVLADAAADADRALADDREPGELAEAARALLKWQAAHEHFTFIAGELARRVSDLMETDETDVPGLARLERKWSRSRTDWQNAQLLADVLRAAQATTAPHAVDPTTGEMVFTWDQAVTALTRFYNLSGYNVRLTQLKQTGLNVGEYSIQGPWRARVTARPINDEGTPQDE